MADVSRPHMLAARAALLAKPLAQPPAEPGMRIARHRAVASGSSR
jgi:hypothetical protein